MKGKLYSATAKQVGVHQGSVHTSHLCVMVRERKLGGSKSTAGLHSQCSHATLM